MLYCSEDPSTALLETLVHMEIDAEDRPQSFQVLKIESMDAVSTERVDQKKLKRDWRTNLVMTRLIGDEWLRSRRSLLLRFPAFWFRNAGTS